MSNHTRTFIYLPILIALALAIAMLPIKISLAESVTVENTVKSSASTGGNSTSNGTVSEGGSKSTIEVRTVINGEVVEDFKNTEEGPDADQTYERTTGAESGQPQVEIMTENALEAGVLENVPRADYPPEPIEGAWSIEKAALIGDIELIRPAFATTGITATTTFEYEEEASLKEKVKNLISHVFIWAF